MSTYEVKKKLISQQYAFFVDFIVSVIAKSGTFLGICKDKNVKSAYKI